MTTNFINFHVLISHSPACLNRDDMNMQKDAIFGGKRRVRISSQSLKRTIRKSDYYLANFGEPSIRTRELELLSDELFYKLNIDGGDNYKKEWIDKTIQAFVSRTVEGDIDDEDVDDVELEDVAINDSKQKKIAVAPWAVPEFKQLYKIVKDVFDSPMDPKLSDAFSKAIEKEHKRKPTAKKPRVTDDEIRDGLLLKEVKKIIKSQSEIFQAACGNVLDIALSGRMATSGLMTTIDGALSMAHAITTHTIDSDIDWFTAVDDLQELGSGHLDTQEFSAGVFYRYASLNIAQLQENLGGAPRSKVLDIAAHLAYLLATEIPNAKQHSFAAFNPADLVMISFSDMPISLANAFETPVKAEQGGGFRLPSIQNLNAYWQRVHTGYGLNERVAQYQLADEAIPDGISPQDTLTQLMQWIRNDGAQ